MPTDHPSRANRAGPSGSGSGKSPAGGSPERPDGGTAQPARGRPGKGDQSAPPPVEVPPAEVPAPEGELAGPELARAVIDAAQARRRAARPQRRTGRSGDGESSDGGARWRPRGYSGPGPDPRDPQPFGAVLARLVKSRGWQRPAAEATVFGAWEKVVGSEIAAHSRPVKLSDGELTVEAESTAWATQLRMLAGSLLQRIAAEVGHNVVKKLRIHGPSAPSWVRGPRRVQGRGPRDTYG
jgi:predicted nucleic acid-binding Zn ribbon protein